MTLKFWPCLLALLAACMTGSGSIILDNETLANPDFHVYSDPDNGRGPICVDHQQEGALVIIGYYPDYMEIGSGSQKNDPAVSIMNWYGMNYQNITDVMIEVHTVESGNAMMYRYNVPSLLIGSGYDTKFVLTGLAEHKREVTMISIRYIGTDQLAYNDAWYVPQDLLQSNGLDYLHVIKRTPFTTDRDGMRYLDYEPDDLGEITRFTLLLW